MRAGGDIVLGAAISIALLALAWWGVDHNEHGLAGCAFVAAMCFVVLTVETAIGKGEPQ